MYKKILFGTCLTEYCNHIFNYALQLAEENDAKLWIYYNLGNSNSDEKQTEQAIKEAEIKVAQMYVDQMKGRGFTNYAINVSDGEVVREISLLARNAAVDLIIMGTSTHTPITAGESTSNTTFGPVAAESVLRAPCPVLIIPPSLIPGLARG